LLCQCLIMAGYLQMTVFDQMIQFMLRQPFKRKPSPTKIHNRNLPQKISSFLELQKGTLQINAIPPKPNPIRKTFCDSCTFCT
jgi:hypothetical protein